MGLAITAVALLSLLFVFHPVAIEGRYIVVGEKANYTNSWNEDYNYTQWMIDNPLYVGDIGVFAYPLNYHVVWQLPDFESYDQCDYSNAIVLAGPTDAPWPLGYFFTVTDQPAYLACGIFGHCEQGQKVILNGSLGPLPKKLANSSAPGIYPYLPPGTNIGSSDGASPPTDSSSTPSPPPPTTTSTSSPPPSSPSPKASSATRPTSFVNSLFLLLVCVAAFIFSNP